MYYYGIMFVEHYVKKTDYRVAQQFILFFKLDYLFIVE